MPRFGIVLTSTEDRIVINIGTMIGVAVLVALLGLERDDRCCSIGVMPSLVTVFVFVLRQIFGAVRLLIILSRLVKLAPVVLVNGLRPVCRNGFVNRRDRRLSLDGMMMRLFVTLLFRDVGRLLIGTGEIGADNFLLRLLDRKSVV